MDARNIRGCPSQRIVTGPTDIAGLDAGASDWTSIMQGETRCSAGLQVTCSQKGSEMKRCTAWYVTRNDGDENHPGVARWQFLMRGIYYGLIEMHSLAPISIHAPDN